jgi:uncharacterized membrane protein YhaH (DUF805 family)
VPSTCMASTRPLPRSDRPDGRSVDATARIWHQVAASRSQHPSRSTACLTTLHEPWEERGAKGDANSKPDAIALIRDDFKWWFPSSLVVASASAIVLVYISQRYYSSFYTSFGLDPIQAGVTQPDTLFRILPIVVLLGLAAFLARASILAKRAQDGDKSPSATSPMTRWWTRFGASVLVPLSCLIVTFGAGAWAGVAKDAGRDDARQVITSRYNYVYSSLWQQMLGTKTLVVTVSWSGTAESNILSDEQLDERGDRYTIARLISQAGATTVYFDLLDCRVHSVPTAQITLVYGPTSFSSEPATEMTEIEGCPNTD